ncbi:MAG: alpha/beta hydrolase [Proteobacteria bacterium]|nr:alpha/beta hydrolase [Pseudomonadota bacterium]
MRRLSIILFITFCFMVSSITGCSNNAKLSVPEKQFDTGGNDLSVFHRVAEHDLGLGLRFPGIIVGIEKAARENIDAGICTLWWGKGQEYDDLDPDLFHKNSKLHKNIQKTLNDCKRMFVSHIVDYKVTKKHNGFEYIEENVLYSAYKKPVEGNRYKNAYARGQEALIQGLGNELRKKVESVKDQEPYTHILLFSMGWNTDQQESMRNYNSLITQMINAANVTFKPLFIGISWPSEWSWPVLEGLGKVLSYPVKSSDADEVALLQVNPLLYEVLIDLKHHYDIPLILLGHSFGARLITRSVFGLPAQRTRQPQSDNIDLVISLQGAFSVNRFIMDNGNEGSPYADFANHAKKFILTWSEFDSANPIAAFVTFAKHSGGIPGYKQSLKAPDIFQQFVILCEHIDNDDNKECKTDKHYDIKFQCVSTEPGDKCVNRPIWDQSFKNGNTISMIDSSQIIFREPHNKGGKAHSDIYTHAIANFVWDAITNIKKIVKP